MTRDKATMLSAAARALSHCAMRKAHCPDGAHFVGEDDATAPLLYPANACLNTDNQQSHSDAATPT